MVGSYTEIAPKIQHGLVPYALMQPLQPCHAITGSSHDLQTLTMLAEEFDGYQSKPISVKNFLEEIRRVLS